MLYKLVTRFGQGNNRYILKYRHIPFLRLTVGNRMRMLHSLIEVALLQDYDYQQKFVVEK